MLYCPETWEANIACHKANITEKSTDKADALFDITHYSNYRSSQNIKNVNWQFIR